MSNKNFTTGDGMSSNSSEFNPNPRPSGGKPQFYSSSKQGKTGGADFKLERNTVSDNTTDGQNNQKQVADEKQVYVAKQNSAPTQVPV